MNTDHEILDVVDEQDQVIAQATRGDIHRAGLRHRAVHIFLFNPEGKLFIQKRAATKDTFPLHYDSSASGHLDTGEDYDYCATREVHEELGIKLTVGKLTRCFCIEACADTGQEFVRVYRAKGDWQPIINPTELAEGKYWSRSEIEDLIITHSGHCAPSFLRIFKEFCRRNLWSAD